MIECFQKLSSFETHFCLTKYLQKYLKFCTNLLQNVEILNELKIY